MIYEATSMEEVNVIIDESRDSKKKSVVLFGAESWCRPCQSFRPHFERAATEVDEITFIKVDIDEVPEAVQDYGVQSVPTCWLFDEDGTWVRDVKVPQGALPFIKDIRS